MSNLGEYIAVRTETRASEKGLVGIEKRWYIQGFIEGFLGAYIKLLHHIMKHFDKTYDEAALHLTLPPAEIELYRPLLQAYVSDQELYRTLLSKAITTIMYRDAERAQATEI